MTNWAEASDAVLVVGIARWNDAALHEVYRRYAGMVLGIARRVTYDSAIAEEICQEVFLSLWREPERFDPMRGSLRSWLATMTHRRAVDVVRAEEARRRRELREQSDRSYPSDAELETATERVVVDTALRALNDAERAVIELAYFGGLTYREVARCLEEPEGTVKSRIRSALSKLGRVLSDVGAKEL